MKITLILCKIQLQLFCVEFIFVLTVLLYITKCLFLFCNPLRAGCFSLIAFKFYMTVSVLFEYLPQGAVG